jgi:hypothetical protein
MTHDTHVWQAAQDAACRDGETRDIIDCCIETRDMRRRD